MPGATIPDVVLERIDGARGVPLSDYRGRLLVLNVWATWCKPCREEMPSLERLSRAGDDGIVVAGLSVDADRNLLLEFLRKHGITFANYSDPGSRVSQTELGVDSLPQTLLVAPDGRLLGRIAGAREWDSPVVRARLDEARRGALVVF